MQKEMKQIYKEWEALGKLKRKPNYLIDVAKGTDYFKLREEIMSNIDKNHLVKYSSDIRCLIYDLNNTHGTRYETLLRFFNLYKNELMKFNIPYTGALMLDVTSYIGYEDSEEFKALVKFIASINEGVMIFFLSEKDEVKNMKMFETLSKALWIERASYHNDISEDAMEHVKKICRENNIEISKDSEIKVKDIVSNIVKNSENSGFKTLDTIFNKIIYKKIKQSPYASILITEDDLKEYVMKKNDSKEVLRMF